MRVFWMRVQAAYDQRVAARQGHDWEAEDALLERWACDGEGREMETQASMPPRRLVIARYAIEAESQSAAEEEAERRLRAELDVLGVRRPDDTASALLVPVDDAQRARVNAYRQLLQAVTPTWDGHPPNTPAAMAARDSRIARALRQVLAIGTPGAKRAAPDLAASVRANYQVWKDADVRFIAAAQEDAGWCIWSDFAPDERDASERA
jgi:hypothetical protein